MCKHFKMVCLLLYNDYKVGPIDIMFVMRSLTTRQETINR